MVFLKLQHHYVKKCFDKWEKGGLRLDKERRADVFGRGSIPITPDLRLPMIYQGVGNIYTVTLTQCISLNASLDCPVLYLGEMSLKLLILVHSYFGERS